MDFEAQIINTFIDGLTPVMEGAVLLAAEYSKKAGRDFVTSRDLEYALKYCTRYFSGQRQGTLFPEMEDEEDPDDIEVVEETENSFTRYEGGDELMNKVNECYDTWHEWEPYSPLEKMLASSIEKNY